MNEGNLVALPTTTHDDEQLPNAVFVYRHKQTGQIKAVYLAAARLLEKQTDDWTHVASLHARLWIELHYDMVSKAKQLFGDTSTIDDLEQENRLLRARNDRLEGELKTLGEKVANHLQQSNRVGAAGLIREVFVNKAAP